MNSPDFFELLNTELPNCKVFLSTVAQLFDLNFEPDSYTYYPLSAQEKVLLDYLGGCPGLPHSNWGEQLETRLDKVKNFLESAEYQNYCEQLGSAGSVLDCEVSEHLTRALQAHDLPTWVSQLMGKLKTHLAHNQPFYVVICLKEQSDETLQRMRKLLVHEWNHLLFFSHGIKFQDLPANQSISNTEYWLYDEGLATWIEYCFVSGQWDCHETLEKILQTLLEKGSPPTVTGYFEKGLWFNQHFLKIPQTQWAHSLRRILDESETYFQNTPEV